MGNRNNANVRDVEKSELPPGFAAIRIVDDDLDLDLAIKGLPWLFRDAKLKKMDISISCLASFNGGNIDYSNLHVCVFGGEWISGRVEKCDWRGAKWNGDGADVSDDCTWINGYRNGSFCGSDQYDYENRMKMMGNAF